MPPVSAEGGKRPTVAEACSILLRNEHAPFQHATETLFKVVQNLIQNPNDPAFRSLKRSSNAFATKLGPAKGAVRFLRAIGFVEAEAAGSSDGAADGVFTMAEPDEVLLAEGKAALKAAVKEYRRMEEEARSVENAAAAEKLRDLREVSKQNYAKRDAAAQAGVDVVEVLASALVLVQVRLRHRPAHPRARSRQWPP